MSRAGGSRAGAVVVGGGIVGLAVARELTARGWRVTVLEKERTWASHQTGRNSNVIHSGLYYRPGSLKATMCRDGRSSMVAFAREHGVPVEVCGKLVVATHADELPRLSALHERAQANGTTVRMLDPAQAREYEPEVAAVAAMRVEETAVTDFPAVCAALVGQLGAAGARLRTGVAVTAVRPAGGRVEVATTADTVVADLLVNCAGLHSDAVARMAGLRPRVRIVPFRGEYCELRPERRHLVRGLIYPVPDPALPFLGVHLTRMVDGSVHAGPNAVLALRREGYRWRDVSARELAGIVAFPGFRRLARRYYRIGWDEVTRSLSRRRFAAALARLVPAVREADLLPCKAGVRAQAVAADGALVDDFLIETAANQIHVLNAPSPAATCALEIARAIAAKAPPGPAAR
jgi:L-2-hydroxyglutarate oxidase